MNKIAIECANTAADHIELMVKTLQARGFSSEQAVNLVCSMLGGAVVYQPFASLATEDTATRH